MTATAASILTYAQSWQGGGVERAQLRLARAWIAAGRRVTLVIGDAAGPLAAEAPPGLEVVGLRSRGMARLISALPGIVRARAPDAVFCPGNHYTGPAAMLRLQLGRACPPIVAKVSNALVRTDQPPPVAWAYRRWLALHPRFLDSVVAMSPAMADETATAMRLSREAIAVIPNPPAVPLAGAVPPTLPPGRFLLGVGRLVWQKRWDRLIAALPRLADRQIALVILGEGAARPELEAQIAALRQERRVSLPGHAADPLPIIAQAAAVALVSDFEGVPGVLREALSLGTPVVATDSGIALREIVGRPHLGTIVQPGDEDGLIAVLDHWLEPTRKRPHRVPQGGADTGRDYLDVFDRLTR